MYVHNVHVSTDQLVGFVIVPDQSTLSVRVAPSSVYPEPNAIFIGELPLSVTIGEILSMLFTVAKTLHVLPARSENVNSNNPFAANVCPVAFNNVTVSVNHVIVAVTS